MKTFIFFITILFSTNLIAQEYRESLGLRGGSSSGLTYRTVYNNDKSAEFMLSTNQGGIQIYSLLEKYKPYVHERIKNVYIYHGFGGHLGYKTNDKFYNYNEQNYLHNSYYNQKSFVVGVDYIIGAEYFLQQFPFSFGIDFKPNFEIQAPVQLKLDLWDVGINLRYCFDNKPNSLTELLKRK